MPFWEADGSDKKNQPILPGKVEGFISENITVQQKRTGLGTTGLNI